MKKIFNHPLFAILVPAAIGLTSSAISVDFIQLYGWSLFLGTPLLVSFLSSFFYSFGRKVLFGSAYGIVITSILTLGVAILAFALDGLICLLMALPLAAILALLGTAFGRMVGQTSQRGNYGASTALLLALLFPVLVAFEQSRKTTTPLRSVTTSIRIDAPIQSVWETVIEFPEIQESPRGIFRWGIAHPIGAHIEGVGVGAIRRCQFSTGDFVEPITIWEAPHLLAFNVIENPAPMKEFSPHGDLDVPHLHGHMISDRGEFRLMEEDGVVTLQGTTWYRHSLSPQFYWGPISDEIIHRIHRRVLVHIKTISESH